MTSTVKWLGGGSDALAEWSGDNGSTGWASIATTPSGTSPLTLVNPLTPVTSKHYTSFFPQIAGMKISTYAINTSVTNYPAVDTFNAFSGVAPGCKWAGARVFHNNGSGTLLELTTAMDNFAGKSIKVANMSLGLSTPRGQQTPAGQSEHDGEQWHGRRRLRRQRWGDRGRCRSGERPW